MKLFRSFVFFALLISCLTAIGQQIKPNSYNYGKVKLWNNPQAVFKFKNTSDKSVLFLPLPFDSKLLVELPEGYIKPGETAEIKVTYFTENTGAFNIDVPVYINTELEALHLVLKGQIKSIHPNALTVCPSIDKSKNSAKSGASGSITVYDKLSKKVINGVDIHLENPNKSYLLEDTKKDMVPISNVNIGLYTVVVSKEGYRSEERMIYINKNSGDFIFELERTPSHSGIVSKQSNGNEEFIELMPEDESEEASIEKVRKMINERFKGKNIVNKDVVVIKENPLDSANIVQNEELKKSELMIPASELPDYNKDGTLNSNKFSSNNIVFIIDVSGSMYRDDKLPLLKESIKEMIKVLRKDDIVTIISYSSKATIHAAGISGDQKELLFAALDTLEAKGNSYGAEGMQFAYEYAQANYIVGGNNQVILASDGMFNSKEYTNNDILNMAFERKGQGIKTSTIFFGKSKEALSFMTDLSKMGQGSYMQMAIGQSGHGNLIEEIKNNSIKK
jgi:hypothetical protein